VMQVVGAGLMIVSPEKAAVAMFGMDPQPEVRRLLAVVRPSSSSSCSRRDACCSSSGGADAHRPRGVARAARALTGRDPRKPASVRWIASPGRARRGRGLLRHRSCRKSMK
jgi:hypothetical protein